MLKILQQSLYLLSFAFFAAPVNSFNLDMSNSTVKIIRPGTAHQNKAENYFFGYKFQLVAHNLTQR